MVELIAKGIDPAAEARRREDDERRAREVARVQDECRFRNVAEDYIKRRVSTQRRARATERVIRNVLVAAWGDKPISRNNRRDVVRLVEHIDGTGAPVYAAGSVCICPRLVQLEHRSRLLQHRAQPVRPRAGRRAGSRVARCRASARCRTTKCAAFGRQPAACATRWAAVQAAALTGMRARPRRRARAGANFGPGRPRQGQVDPAGKVQVQHHSPGAAVGDALAVIATVPRFKRGDHLFSFSYGERPALILHQAKVRLDR